MSKKKSYNRGGRTAADRRPRQARQVRQGPSQAALAKQAAYQATLAQAQKRPPMPAPVGRATGGLVMKPTKPN